MVAVSRIVLIINPDWGDNGFETDITVDFLSGETSVYSLTIPDAYAQPEVYYPSLID